jgi:hypothetical protein
VLKVQLPLYGELDLKFGIYGDGHMYLSLYQGHVYTTNLTVRLEEFMDTLEPGEFFFNRQKLAEYENDIFDSNFFEHTGKVIVSGYHTYPVWRYKNYDRFTI